MKIQLLQKQDEVGRTYYQVNKDGLYVSGTVTFSFEEAVVFYNEVVKNNTPVEPIILMETEISK